MRTVRKASSWCIFPSHLVRPSPHIVHCISNQLLYCSASTMHLNVIYLSVLSVHTIVMMYIDLYSPWTVSALRAVLSCRAVALTVCSNQNPNPACFGICGLVNSLLLSLGCAYPKRKSLPPAPVHPKFGQTRANLYGLVQHSNISLIGLFFN